MKSIFFRTVVENKSRHSIQYVWENAQDLEHVTFLHGHTNSDFQLLFTYKSPQSKLMYDALVYRSKRKVLKFFKLNTFGFRQIVGDYNIHQFEMIPILGAEILLNSQLLPTGDSEFPTLMFDEVITKVPFLFKPLVTLMQKSLQRHARIQCQEDEPFRERRQDLRQRGISLPASLFALSRYQMMVDILRKHQSAEGYSP